MKIEDLLNSSRPAELSQQCSRDILAQAKKMLNAQAAPVQMPSVRTYSRRSVMRMYALVACAVIVVCSSLFVNWKETAETELVVVALPDMPADVLPYRLHDIYYDGDKHAAILEQNSNGHVKVAYAGDRLDKYTVTEVLATEVVLQLSSDVVVRLSPKSSFAMFESYDKDLAAHYKSKLAAGNLQVDDLHKIRVYAYRGNESFISVLEKASYSRDAVISQQAADILGGSISNFHTIRRLITVVETSQWPYSMDAIKVLGRSNSPLAKTFLRLALDRRDDKMLFYIVEAVIVQGDRRAIAQITDIMRDPTVSQRIRKAAQTACKTLSG